MNCYNSPYGVEEYGDVRVNNSVVSLESEKYISCKDGMSICKSCFYGLHPHDIKDCKVILKSNDEKTIGQCCCTWYKGSE